MRIHFEACLDSSSSRGDSLESAVPVRVGQHQLRPRPVAVHHHLPAPLGVELLVHQNPLYYPADINITLIQTYFGIAKTVPGGVGCSKPGAIVLVTTNSFWRLLLHVSKFDVQENGRPSTPDVAS